MDMGSTKEGRQNAILELLSIYPQNKFLKSIQENVALPEQEIASLTNIWSMTAEEMEKYYYKGLLNSCKGNQKKAAERAGIPYATFRSRSKKLGII